MYEYFNKATTITITFKNPILTYATEGISPRDLPADIELNYDHVENESCAFPVCINKENIDLKQYRDIIYQAYKASIKIHKVAQEYDGNEYDTYVLFFIDDKHKIRLYEIIGEESFRGKAKVDRKMIKDELELVTLL